MSKLESNLYMRLGDTMRVKVPEEVTLEPGDLVSLVSGGPEMTVIDVCDACGDVEVVWFNGDDMQFAKLPKEALI